MKVDGNLHGCPITVHSFVAAREAGSSKTDTKAQADVTYKTIEPVQLHNLILLAA